MDNQLAEQIAEDLLKIGAVSLRPTDPFTWTSGMKSPIYCDNRLTLSFPDVRKRIADGLAALIHTHFSNADIIAGTATAGIPHAALVSERLGLPMVYVRSSAKSHGKGNQIEGNIGADDRVVVIEDLISTGGSVINATNALREAETNVLGGVAIFSYGLKKAKNHLDKARLDVHTLTNLDALLDVATTMGEISHSGQRMIRKWRAEPESANWLNEN